MKNIMILRAATVVCFVVITSFWVGSTNGVVVDMTLHEVSENAPRCQDCKRILAGIRVLMNVLPASINAENIFSRVCVAVTPMLGHNSTMTCPHLLQQYLPDVRSVFLDDILSGACEILEICPMQNSGNESIPASLPPFSLHKTHIVQVKGPRFQTNQHSSEPLTFVQISDIHLDKDYVENAVTHCGYSICCRSNLTGNGSAGAFGSYNCDAAEPTVRVLLDFIRNMNPAPAFFVYAGDNSPHILLDTIENKMDDNQLVNTLLVDKLRSIGPIFPALGNHETFPTSSYNRLNSNTQTLLQSLGEQWPSMFHVMPDQMSTIRKHAYYTALIMSGLRILAVNPLYDYLYNIYALRPQMDPAKAEQRQFMRHTLTHARQNNEKVILVSHMKPSPFQTYPSYSDDHNQLITDFYDVIILQLFGHEHSDVFLLNRDPASPDRITGVSLAAPSVTTYFGSNLGVNPSIRVYKIDPITFKPLDYDQYYISIPESNEKGVAEVKKHYTFTEEYQLPDLSPSSFGILSDRIHTNWTDFQKFEANFYVLADDRPSCSMEDTMCRRRLTCQTRESKPLGFAACLLEN